MAQNRGSEIDSPGTLAARRRFRSGARVCTVLALTMLAGLLLWSKLKMIANLPRMAYAQPRQVETTGDERAGVEAAPAERKPLGAGE